MLCTSKIMSFIDNKEGHVVYFFEGQRIIHDLALIHDLKGESFSFLRDSILGSQLLSTLLKEKENFGFYIDLEGPYLRFKIETNHSGYMRTLLLPEGPVQIPKKITGLYRVSKIIEGGTHPYNTIIDFKDKTLEEVINQLFRDSFQINGKIKISQDSDQSVFIMKLPDIDVDRVDKNTERLTVDEYWRKNKPFIQKLFSEGHNKQAPIEKAFTENSFVYLGSTDIQFKCSCSRERMIIGILALLKSTSVEEVFQEDDFIETKCDYCKTFYEMTKTELLKRLETL